MSGPPRWLDEYAHSVVVNMVVSNVFFHGDLYEDVYMQLPLGYHGPGSRVSPTFKAVSVRGSSKVCRLQKSLYGLKQALKQWFAKLSTSLISFGYV